MRIAVVSTEVLRSSLHDAIPTLMALPAIFSLPSIEASLDQVEPAVRLRLVSCRIEHDKGAVTRALVECEGPSEGKRTVGLQEGSTCPGGDLRLAALATMDAIVQATCGALRLELIGVKPLRVFDTSIVVVAVLAHHEGKVTRIVGAATAEDDTLVGTARATLHAVNRLAAPMLARLVA